MTKTQFILYLKNTFGFKIISDFYTNGYCESAKTFHFIDKPNTPAVLSYYSPYKTLSVVNLFDLDLIAQKDFPINKLIYWNSPKKLPNFSNFKYIETLEFNRFVSYEALLHKNFDTIFDLNLRVLRLPIADEKYFSEQHEKLELYSKITGCTYINMPKH